MFYIFKGYPQEILQMTYQNQLRTLKVTLGRPSVI